MTKLSREQAEKMLEGVTPTPWWIDDHGNVVNGVYGEDLVAQSWGSSTEQADVNTRAIASTPDALQTIIALYEQLEAERTARLLKTHHSPVFLVICSLLGAVLGGSLIIGAFSHWWSGSIPMLLLGVFFLSMLFVGPALIRIEREERRRATLTESDHG